MDEKVKELYLAHHGVKGQKWGIRRYQNEDGTLTAEGQARYGDKKTYNGKGTVGSFLSKDWGVGLLRNYEERNSKKQMKDKSLTEEERAKVEKRYKAQEAKNRNLEAYMKHTSTAKLVMQNLLLSPVGAMRYHQARARGSGRIASFFESGIDPLGLTLSLIKNKKRYGKAIVLGDREEGINFKENMDE